MKVILISDFIFMVFILIGLLLLLIMSIIEKQDKNYPKPLETKKLKFAILIPARDESRVIGGLLLSIKKQSRKIIMKDVYVIIESEDDPTKKIAKEFGASIVIRKRLDLKRKGYALDEGMKYIIEKGKSYDAYFIFDADNVLDEDFILELEDTYKKGYDIGMGYRNTKNGNANAIAAASTLTFSMINTLGNSKKNKVFGNITLSGTGFYINGSILEELGGFPFNSLTEDYELTMYSVLHGFTTYYNDKAIFYDEQPEEFKVSIKQRTRWIKGFFDVRKKYGKKVRRYNRKTCKNCGSRFSYGLGIIPYIIMVVGVLVDLAVKIIGLIYYIFVDTEKVWMLVLNVLSLFILIYLVLFLVTALMLLKEGNKINLNFKSKVKSLLFNPFFLASYVICLVKAFKNKSLGWEKIEHKTS